MKKVTGKKAPLKKPSTKTTGKTPVQGKKVDPKHIGPQLKGRPLTEDDLAKWTSMFDLLDPEKVKREKDIRYMISNMEEFLSTFLLLGYTMDGKPVTVSCAKTQKDTDALNSSLQNYIFQHFGSSDNRGNPGGGLHP